MSLNASEQMVFDYVQAHPEEKRFWTDKVRAVGAAESDGYAAATELELELWRYFEERSRAASPFREAAARQGMRRTSFRNLAEHLLRLWGPSRPRPLTQGSPENFKKPEDF